MRELHADRLDSDGSHIVVMDLESGEEFIIPIDKTLRSLVNPAEPGTPTAPEPPMPDANSPATGVTEPEQRAAAAPSLTPREIQGRIRAGSSAEELAVATGVSVDKITRFAHPVLLERARAAELARASHPRSVDGPVAGTLGEIVAECLALRGIPAQKSEWDAWRSESGQWMVQVRPDPADEATARWRFTPGSHGGITEPMDDLAVELTEPELARTVRRPVVAPVPVERDPEPEPAPRPSPPSREIDAEGHEFVTVDADDLTEQQQQRRRGPQFDEVLDLRYDDETRVEAPTPREENESTTPRHRGKRATPTVPAWEDVLLGVRSHPND
ncbi:septation protein SepH [Gordonia sp. (in: high G+C Gram-positive bacteria)]|uniref:septation protein SepH n=1 Tax=Gordonia sp. (in: high G+C Gram-positive bacteria) TaxID=84139 RepID=UPI003C776F77